MALTPTTIVPGTNLTAPVTATFSTPGFGNTGYFPGTSLVGQYVIPYNAGTPYGPGAVASSGRNVEPYEFYPFFDTPYTGQPTTPQFTGNEFTRGVNRGFQQLQALGYGALGLTGDLVNQAAPPDSTLGLGLRDYGYEGYLRNMEEASAYPKAVERIEDINGIGSAADWVAGTAGELVPNILGLLIPGGIAAGAARTVGSRALQKAATAQIKTAVASGMTEQAAMSAINANLIPQVAANAARARTIGMIGLGASSSGIEAGANWTQSVQNRGINNTNPGTDLAFGIASGLTDVILGAEGSVLRTVLGKPVTAAAENAARRSIAAGIARTMFQEGGQESLQEILSITNQGLQEHNITLTEDDVSDILNAAAAGMLGGGLMSPATIANVRAYNRNIQKSDDAALANQVVLDQEYSTVPNDTYHFDAVDKNAIVSDATQQLNPYAVAQEQQRAILETKRTETQQKINDINVLWDDTLKGLTEQAVNLEAEINDLLNTSQPGRNATIAQMTPAERRAEADKIRNSRLANILAQIAKIEENRNTAIEAETKDLYDYDRQARTVMRKAATRQAEVDYKNRNQRLVNDVDFQVTLDQIASDVETFANRESDLLDKRIRAIKEAIIQTNGLVEELGTQLGPDGNIQGVAPQRLFDYRNRRVQGLERDLNRALYKQQEIRRLAKDAINKTVTATDADLSSLGLDIQNLYSYGDVPNTSITNSDLFSSDVALAQDVHKQNLKELSNKLKTAQDSIGQVNLRNDPVMTTAQAILQNARNSISNEINTDAQVPFGYSSSSELAEAQSKEIQYQSEASVAEQELSEYVRQYDRNKQEWENFIAQQEFLRRVGENRLPFNQQQTSLRPQVQVALEQMENTQQGIETVQEVTTQELENADAINEAAIRSTGQPLTAQREVALEAQDTTEANGAEYVEQSRLTPNGKKVRGWLSNSLSKNPSLQANTIFAVDGNDIVLPVEVQNKLFAHVRNTGQHPTGAYFNGKIYIFENAIQSKEQAIRTIIHEGVVHFGLRSIMSEQQFTSFMNSVFDSFKNTDIWNRFVQSNPEVFASYNKLLQAEEFVAWLGQQQQLSRLLRTPAETAFQKLKSLLTKILNAFGLTRVTEVDIMDVLSASAHYLANSDANGVYINENVSMLDPNGSETLSTDPGVNKQAWGIYFNSPIEAIAYNTSLSKNVSGIPGTSFIQYDPSVENTLVFQLTLAEQSPLVRELISNMTEMSDISFTDNPDGSVSVNLYGKDLGVFPDRVDAERYLNSDELYTEFNGKEFYDYLTDRLGSQKDAGLLLRSYGILGANTGTTTDTYVLFTGDEASLSAQNPSIPYTEPLFMNQDGAINNTLDLTRDQIGDVNVIEDEINQQDKNAKDGTLLEQLAKEYDARVNWIQAARNAKRSGVSRNEDGTLKYGFMDRAIEYVADRYRPVQLIQRVLEESRTHSPINYRTNVYKQLTGLNNRIHNQQLNTHDEFVNPLIDIVKEIDLPTNLRPTDYAKHKVEYIYAALGDYMWARHAPERNRAVNERFATEIYRDSQGRSHVRRVEAGTSKSQIINPSGLSDTRAAEIFEMYDNVPGFKEAALQVDKINEARLTLMLDAKLITEEVARKLLDTYQYYVPLKGWESFVDDVAPNYYKEFKQSSGLSVGNKARLQYAKGRSGLPQNPVVQSVMQLYDTVAVVEKTEIGRSFLELVKEAPDADLWEISGKEPGLYSLNRTSSDNIVLREKGHKNEGKGYSQFFVVDEDTNIVRISIKDPTLAKSMRGENLAPTSAITEYIRRGTRFLSMLQTSRNPAFILSNPLRDFETAILNMGNVVSENEKRGLLDKQAQLKSAIAKDVLNWSNLKNLFSIVRGNAEAVKNADPQLLRDYQDFADNGGHTRIFDSGTFEATYKNLVKETTQDSGGKAAFKAAVEMLDNLSDVTENITRFSVYRNVQRLLEDNVRQRAKENPTEFTPEVLSREIQLTKQKAANIALESTVNFTRKGSGAPIFNSLYAFSSATIQGSVRIMQNLWRRGDTWQNNARRLSKYLAVGASGAFVQGILCRMWMGDDDDGISYYDKIPDYVKYRNFIIPNPFSEKGGYIKIPLAYGYNIFWTVGAAMDDAIQGNKHVPSVVADVLKESLGAFSPVDPIDEGFTAWVPTIFRPAAQVAANITFSGVPIYPENTGRTIPDSQKFWAKTPAGYKMIASWLNTMTGGSQVESGWIDISPESIEHMFLSYTGGLGRMAMDTLGIFTTGLTGDDWDINRIPIVNRLYGEVSYSNTSALYNRIAGQVEAAKNAYRIANEDPKLSTTERQSIFNEYRDAYSLVGQYNATQRQMSNIRQREREIARRYGSALSSEYVRQMNILERQKEALMKRFLSSANRTSLPLLEGE